MIDKTAERRDTVQAPPRQRDASEVAIDSALLALDVLPNNDRLRQARSLLIRARKEIENYFESIQHPEAP